MKKEHKKFKSAAKLIHARECRLKVGSNRRSKGKEALKMVYTHTFRQYY